MKKSNKCLFVLFIFLLNEKCTLCQNDSITENCGGHFSGYQYSISSPNYPSEYPTNQDCFYFLHGSRLARCEQEFHLQFLDLDLRASENCEKDYLQIGEQNIYCGSNVGLRTFKGKNNILKIHFHSGKEGVGGKKFKILVTTFPCINSQGESRILTNEEMTPRTENSTKPLFKEKTESKNHKTFSDKLEKENSNKNRFEVETLYPTYRPQVIFPSGNNFNPIRGDSEPKKNCSESKKLAPYNYLYLPPSSSTKKNLKLKNSNFSITPPSTEFLLPVLESSPFRSSQKNLNKLTFARHELSTDNCDEPKNEIGVGVSKESDCENTAGNREENKIENNFPDRNFPGNSGVFPNFGNGMSYQGEIGGSGVIGHSITPGIGHGTNSDLYPGIGTVINTENTGISTGINSGIYPGVNKKFNPGIDKGIFPGIDTGINPGIYPGTNPVINTGLNPGIYPGINTGIYPEKNPEIYPGTNPGINIGLNPVIYPGIDSGINPGINPNSYPGIDAGINTGINPGINTGISPGINPGIIPGINPNPYLGINLGIDPNYYLGENSGINPDFQPGIHPGNPNLGTDTNVNPQPISPNFASNFPGVIRECCNILNPNLRSLISSPGFPTLIFSPIPFDCGYTIRRFSPEVCRLRLNFKFFNFGTDDPQCLNGHLEVDSRRICGCKSGLSLVVPFGIYPSKTINVRYLRYPKTKFNGFLIEIVQEICINYPLIRNRKDLSEFNETSSFLKKEEKSTISAKSIISSEDSHARRKREGYSYPKPTSHAILDVHSDRGRSEGLFWNSCQARAFIDWTLAAKEAFIRGARCPGTGSLGEIIPVIPSPGGWDAFPGICEEISALEGVISSPSYPYYYPNNFRKCYRFYKSRGICRLEVSVLDFDLESSLGCRKDYLLFSGQNKRYCGDSLSGTTTIFDLSRSNIAEIYFITDASGTGRGFTSGFTQIPC